MRRGYFRGFRREHDLSVYSQAYLNKVARQLNERPRPRDSKPSRNLTPVLRRPVEPAVISGQTIVGQNPAMSAIVQERTNAGAVGLSAMCQGTDIR